MAPDRPTTPTSTAPTSTAPTSTAPTSTTALRVATTALFALSGFVFGSWAARLPDISHAVSAGPTSLGIALLCLSLGALATMPLTGRMSARWGAGPVSAAAAALLSVTAVLPPLAGSVTSLGAVLLLFGAATGMVNVAANSLGVRLETLTGRTLLPYLHAGFSFGGLAGALAGGLAGAAVGPAAHLLTVGGAGLLLTAAVAPTLVRSAPADRPTGADGHPAPTASAERVSGARTPLVLLGAMAGCTAFAEGALADWGALHLRDTLLASPAVAAAGYAGFSLAMGLGRLGGGRLIERLGDTTLLATGSLLAFAGLLAAALSPSVAVALAGFALVGLGLANVFPVAIARAGARAGAAGVALASTVGYTGLLVGPPLVGVVAEHAGLRTAMATLSALAVGAAVLAVVTDAHATPAALRRWRGAASLGPALMRAVAVRGAPQARRHAVDLALLVQPAPRVGPRVHVSDADLLFG